MLFLITVVLTTQVMQYQIIITWDGEHRNFDYFQVTASIPAWRDWAKAHTKISQYAQSAILNSNHIHMPMTPWNQAHSNMCTYYLWNPWQWNLYPSFWKGAQRMTNAGKWKLCESFKSVRYIRTIINERHLRVNYTQGTDRCILLHCTFTSCFKTIGIIVRIVCSVKSLVSVLHDSITIHFEQRTHFTTHHS
jgi:hypothetical protein